MPNFYYALCAAEKNKNQSSLKYLSTYLEIWEKNSYFYYKVLHGCLWSDCKINKVAGLAIPVSSLYRTLKEIWSTVLIDLFVTIIQGRGPPLLERSKDFYNSQKEESFTYCLQYRSVWWINADGGMFVSMLVVSGEVL